MFTVQRKKKAKKVEGTYCKGKSAKNLEPSENKDKSGNSPVNITISCFLFQG